MKHAGLDIDRFRSAVAAMPQDELAAWRRSAGDLFARTGFPTTREENWKYTNLASASELGNAWLDELIANKSIVQEPAPPGLADDLRAAIDADWIVVRNGTCDADALAVLDELSGVSASLLSSADNKDLSASSQPLSAFNAALLRDGLHIEVAADTAREKPIGLLYVDGETARASQTRTVIHCAERASLNVIACEISADGQHFSNRVNQFSLAAGANLNYVRLQREGSEHIATNRSEIRLAAGATVQHASFDFGGELIRNDVDVEMAAPDACADILGIYLAAGSQHVDNHVQVTHATGPADSNQHFRGILGDRARCVFNGKALVLEGADGTDARQANHNLLLSEKAEIDTKPELEIYADDVKCSHGATVGQLDETAIFYLQSRGIDRDAAKQMLTRAFVSEIIESVNVDGCKSILAELIERRLNEVLDSQNDE